GGDLTIASSLSSTGTLTLTSSGAITDASFSDIITAPTLQLSASTGIGTGPISLRTQVGTLGADNTTGNIVISNGVTMPVTLNIAGTDSVQVTGASGAIVLANVGTLNILTDGKTIRGPGDVVVQTLGAAADINTGGQSSS